MTFAKLAAAQCKKAMKLSLSIFRRGFNSSKCKTMVRMAVARIKLLRNKRQVVVKQMRRDVALLLKSGQEDTARIRVEHVMREQNFMAANEFLELFCELITTRLSIISKRRECPADLKEGISSLIFAAPRCSDIPELLAIRDVFQKKYGKDFVSAATDLRPGCNVNRSLIDKLSVRTPSGEQKLKVMKEIAKEYQIDWDTTESEMELLKPPEELIGGPSSFAIASIIPLKSEPMQPAEQKKPVSRPPAGDKMHFQSTASASKAAAKFAKKAIAAADAAAYLANKDSSQGSNSESDSSHSIITREHGLDKNINRSESSNGSHYLSNGQKEAVDTDGGKVHRKHSCNIPPANSDIKFDESDCDEEIEVEEPPSGVPSSRALPRLPLHLKRNSTPCVHPKLPDYDLLAARFEALKYPKS